jgi:hypothetical protein
MRGTDAQPILVVHGRSICNALERRQNEAAKKIPGDAPGWKGRAYTSMAQAGSIKAWRDSINGRPEKVPGQGDLRECLG